MSKLFSSAARPRAFLAPSPDPPNPPSCAIAIASDGSMSAAHVGSPRYASAATPAPATGGFPFTAPASATAMHIARNPADESAVHDAMENGFARYIAATHAGDASAPPPRADPPRDLRIALATAWTAAATARSATRNGTNAVMPEGTCATSGPMSAR